jgi:pimeloyl-ACP methyl ester carboxylesterase
MTSTLPSSCALGAAVAPECSKRLVLRECLDRFRQEAVGGTFDTGRYRCPYVVWGRGPTLVLIPGMACDAEAFVMLLARLQRFFRCISYDLPNGVTDGARLHAYRHEDLAADLLGLLDHLQVRVCTLFGFSFGSTIALDALHRHPDRFPRGILQAGFAHRPISRAEAFCASWGRFLPGRLGHIPGMRKLLAHHHRAAFEAREPEVWDYFLDAHLRAPLAAFAARALQIHRFDFRSRLSAIAQPMLLVCGDRDVLVGKACEAELLRSLPRCARAELEQCGHHPHLTHPEVLAEVVQQFSGGEWTIPAKTDLVDVPIPANLVVGH